MSDYSLDELIAKLGKDGFRGLSYNKTLLNDGLSSMMWTVTFILKGDVVMTEPTITPDVALSVAITARNEAMK